VSFGILAHHWKFLLTTMQHRPETIAIIVAACIILHNVMPLFYPGLQNNGMDDENANHKIIPGEWRATPGMHDSECI
jgi:hypothetical protein